MVKSENLPESGSEAIGLIAGNGRFPFLVLEEAERRGIPVITIAIQEETDPSIQELAANLHWVGLGQVGRCVRILKKAGVRRALMAGQVKHKQIFHLLRPDWLLLKVLARLRTRNTDAILKTVADVLAEEGIDLMDSTLFLTPLIAASGTLGRRCPTSVEKEDIDFGFRMAKELSRLDIGQTVVVKGKAIVAVEAMEGTDETIRRAGQIVSATLGGLTVVKVARPGQDMRFDVPVVGPSTVDTMVDAGATVLALEAGKTLLLERDELLRRADAAEIAVIGETESNRSPSDGES
jgi:DUF1009 family protein